MKLRRSSDCTLFVHRGHRCLCRRQGNTRFRVANQRHNNAIPENVFIKPPSAELRLDQKDTDSLRDYEVLDQILRGYIENQESPQQVCNSLHLPLALVRDIVNKVDRNEYKRQQAAPGLKVTIKAFGVSRRFPIAQRFSE